jgi:HK97 gp10 family phage protein
VIKVKVEGLRALQQGLAELPLSLARGAARRALIKAALPIAAHAQSLVPEDTGHLKKVIGVSATLTKRQRQLAGGGAAFAGMDAGGKAIFRGVKKGGVEVHIGPLTDLQNYAAPDPAGLMREFGTATQPAQPFLRPAWDAGKMGAVETLKRELGADIERTAARMARRQAKGAR